MIRTTQQHDELSYEGKRMSPKVWKMLSVTNAIFNQNKGLLLGSSLEEFSPLGSQPRDLVFTFKSGIKKVLISTSSYPCFYLCFLPVFLLHLLLMD